MRDLGSDWLSVYSMKPKRYTMDECWGYQERNWDEIAATVNAIVDGVRNAMADSFQMFADALRTGGREE